VTVLPRASCGDLILLSFKTAKKHTLSTLTGLIGFIQTKRLEAFSTESEFAKGEYNAYNEVMKQIRNIVEEVDKYKL